DVTPLADAPAAAARFPAGALLAPHPAAEEGVEEIGEGVGIAEHLAHFFLGHRTEAAAGRAAEVDVPATAGLSAEPLTSRRTALFVHAPVRPELVVLLALRGIAQHFIGLVDLFEARLGRLVSGIDVR